MGLAVARDPEDGRDSPLPARHLTADLLDAGLHRILARASRLEVHNDALALEPAPNTLPPPFASTVARSAPNRRCIERTLSRSVVAHEAKTISNGAVTRRATAPARARWQRPACGVIDKPDSTRPRRNPPAPLLHAGRITQGSAANQQHKLHGCYIQESRWRTPMLSNFEVANFKSIRLLNIPMRPFMVLVGPNGAGKTNVVQALDLLGQLVRRGTVDPVSELGYDQIIRRAKKPARAGLYFGAQLELPPAVVRRSAQFAPHLPPGQMGPVTAKLGIGVTGSVESEEVSVWKEELSLTSQRGTFAVSVEWNPKGEQNVKVDVGNDAALWAFFTLGLPAFRVARGRGQPERAGLQEAVRLFLTQPEDESERRALRLVSWQRLLSPWTRYLRDALAVTRLRLDASSLREDSKYDEQRPHLLGPSGEGLAAAVAKLRGPTEKGTEAFQEVLRSLQQVYPRIEDVKPSRVQPGRVTLLFKERGISEDLGQSNVSDGVLHALALLVALGGGLKEPGPLVIEEPENAIHPWSLRAMIERAQDPTLSRQLLLTTHSETVVNAVRDPAALLVVENGSRGTTVTRALDREKTLASILKESGQRLGDVWVQGELGGVPGGETVSTGTEPSPNEADGDS